MLFFDTAGQTIGPILKGQADGTAYRSHLVGSSSSRLRGSDRPSANRWRTSNLRCATFLKSGDLLYTSAEASDLADWTYFSLHVNCPIVSSDCNQIRNPQQIFIKASATKFHWNPSSGSLSDARGRTAMTKLIGAFHYRTRMHIKMQIPHQVNKIMTWRPPVRHELLQTPSSRMGDTFRNANGVTYWSTLCLTNFYFLLTPTSCHFYLYCYWCTLFIALYDVIYP
jgi:hypothetical protein